MPEIPVEPGPAAEDTVSAPEAAEEHAEYALEPAAPPPPEAPPMTPEAFLNELTAELGELEPAEISAPQPATAADPVPSKPVSAAAGRINGDPGHELAEVFEEFRAELGGLGEEEEDLETRYNLGIAYREMGLIEEAIGEFQRVAQAVAAGRPFRYAMQCCTLLALCFMEKNQPKVAAMWYERALRTPGLDPETEIALRYDLGVALEQAGQTRAALDCFTLVYAMNIDYRDVAERISALEKHR
jgi:tetratricopeptide (TPR) repeat protein